MLQQIKDYGSRKEGNMVDMNYCSIWHIVPIFAGVSVDKFKKIKKIKNNQM